jgi:hypothetical protein
MLFIIYSNVSSFTQANTKMQAINDRIRNINGEWENNCLPPSILRTFNRDDIPVIYDIAFDKKISFETREKAVWLAANLNPDQTQIDRIVNYISLYLPIYYNHHVTDDISPKLADTLVFIYKNTHDDNLLKPLRTTYENGTCDDECKMYVLQRISNSDSVKNRPFYNTILHNPGSNNAIRNYAAIGLAKTDSIDAIPYLHNILEYIYEPEPLPEHSVMFIAMATDALGKMSSKHYQASKEIQDRITKACNTDTDKYGVSLKIPENINDLFIALENDSSEGNRKYFENLLDASCKYKGAKRWAIEALGTIGNEGTIPLLDKHASVAPEIVKKAIVEIQTRIKKKG